ncbi:MAG: hypothetical protein IPH20_27245 [Bacteroidales bacterium]|nr:hypothetical protein [Bacteroidales bacterium]
MVSTDAMLASQFLISDFILPYYLLLVSDFWFLTSDFRPLTSFLTSYILLPTSYFGFRITGCWFLVSGFWFLVTGYWIADLPSVNSSSLRFGFGFTFGELHRKSVLGRIRSGSGFKLWTRGHACPPGQRSGGENGRQ